MFNNSKVILFGCGNKIKSLQKLNFYKIIIKWNMSAFVDKHEHKNPLSDSVLYYKALVMHFVQASYLTNVQISVISNFQKNSNWLHGCTWSNFTIKSYSIIDFENQC